MIKKWKDFIKEAKQLNLFQDTEWDTDEPELVHLGLYPISKEDLEDYLLEIEESGYIVNIQFGFVDSNNRYVEDITKYSEKTAISITIAPKMNANHEDVTSCLRSTINKMKRFFSNINLYDDNGIIKLSDIVIKNGIFIKTEPNDLLSIEGALFVLFASDKETKLTDELICKYYNFSDDITYDKSGNAGVAIPRTRLSDLVVSNKCSWKSVTDSPDYEMDIIDYDRSDYLPSHEDFFNYYLQNDTIRLLLEFCFKDWEKLKEEYSDIDDTIFDHYENREDLIQKVIKPKDRGKYGDREQVGSFLQETELGENIYNELRETYADWESQAKMDDDYEQIMNKFDKVVEDNLDTTILEKFYKQDKTNYRRDGEVIETTFENPYYRIKFNLNWLQYTDSESKLNGSIDDCIYDFDPERTDFDPYFNDYASVDWKEFNLEAKYIIERKMSKYSSSS